MKHLIIALVLSVTASISMACDQAPGAWNQKGGALTRGMVKPATMTYNQVINHTVKSSQQK